jgi:hypothetical protein
MPVLVRSSSLGVTLDEPLSRRDVWILAAWACNIIAWIALVARVQEPVSIVLAVATGWCAIEGIRLRSFSLVVASLVNAWWLLA